MNVSQSQTITVQFGPVANDIGVHYWNAVTASLGRDKQNPRLQSLVHGGELCTPNLVIFDRRLGVQQVLECTEDNLANTNITVDQDSWLRYNSSPINALHYHPVSTGKDANIFQNTTRIDEAFEESLRSISEKLDYLKYFQILTEATSAFASICDDSLFILQDLYPKIQVSTTSLVEPEPKLPTFASSLVKFFESSTGLLLLDTKNTFDSSIHLASFIDTLNAGGFPWLHSSSIYHASFNGVPLFNNIASTKSFGIARNSLEDADVSIPEPAYITKSPSSKGDALEIDRISSFTQLYRNSPELGNHLKGQFQDKPTEFSSHAFKSLGADPDLYSETLEGLHRIIEVCLPFAQ